MMTESPKIPFYVYVMRFERPAPSGRPFLKVGITGDPRQRRRELRKKYKGFGSGDFELVSLIVGDPHKLEHHAHARLEEHALGTETYDVEPRVAVEAIVAAAAQLGVRLVSADPETCISGRIPRSASAWRKRQTALTEMWRKIEGDDGSSL